MRQSLASELFDFYRRGATVASPRRDLDRSHWRHRALVAAHVVASAWIATLVVGGGITSMALALTAAAFVYLGHRAVDPVNGLVHFALDNYFARTTPLVGTVVDGFLNHHDSPEDITRIQFARNVAGTVTVSLPFLLLLIAMHRVETLPGIALSSFFGTFFVETGFSLECHKYVHMSPASLPRVIKWLQDRELILTTAAHDRHHAGFDADYASVTGKSNRYLTDAVYHRMERVIYELTRRTTGVGVEPRSWQLHRAPSHCHSHSHSH
jgi:hypothetical protein